MPHGMEASVATGVMGEKWRFFEEPVAGSTRSLVSATGGEMPMKWYLLPAMLILMIS